jgi:hypothetical protein
MKTFLVILLATACVGIALTFVKKDIDATYHVGLESKSGNLERP